MDYQTLSEDICRVYCEQMSPEHIEEAGCHVCGMLAVKSTMLPAKSMSEYLHLLEAGGVTRRERFTTDDAIRDLGGPITIPHLPMVCKSCVKSLEKGRTPVLSLANGNWIGDVPTQLQGLSFAEKMMVSRVRHNKCIVRVQSGMHKMCGNAVLFPNPTPAVYQELPPKKEELDEVLAVIFVGPARPIPEDLRRVPLLVSRNKVAAALEWLKLKSL